jgi:hypothetical protein
LNEVKFEYYSEKRRNNETEDIPVTTFKQSKTYFELGRKTLSENI